MNFVNANGRPLSIERLKAEAHMQRRPKPKAEGAAEFHKGWRVQGHPPGAMELAQAEADRLLSLWNKQTEQEKAEALRSGDRAPAQWDELRWRRETRKKPVRAKPYEVPEAARLCVEMATKAGWLDVEAAEIKKSKSDA